MNNEYLPRHLQIFMVVDETEWVIDSIFGGGTLCSQMLSKRGRQEEGVKELLNLNPTKIQSMAIDFAGAELL